jgi:hypothetical protein
MILRLLCIWLVFYSLLASKSLNWGCHRKVIENCAFPGFTTARRAQFLTTSWWRPQITQIFYSQTAQVYNRPFQKFSLRKAVLRARLNEKIFPPKNLVYRFWAGKFFPFLLPPSCFPTFSHLRLPVGAVVVATRCLCCCCLRNLEPGGLELPNLGSLGRRLILELRDKLLSQGILTEKFPAPSSCRSRTAEVWITGPSSYPLDHEVLVDRIISDLPDKV